MSETSRPSSDDSTPVTIFGRTYHLRGGGGTGELTELAELVDRKMREVAEATGTADTLKVAILASLNIADDYLRASRDGDLSSDGLSEKRMARMVAMLDEVLAE
jgi:cell division protein ZapA